MLELLIMSERLLISLPEVYRRVNNIENPVKRAGAQAFSGIYSPVLSLPEYFHRPVTVTAMRNRALRAKEYAMKQANDGIGEQPPEVFDFSELDTLAKNAGLRPLDLLDLPSRLKNSLLRSYAFHPVNKPLTLTLALAELNRWSIDHLTGLRNVSYASALDTRRELNTLTGLTCEQMEERIAGVIEKKIEASKLKSKENQGKILADVAGHIFDSIGHKILDEIPLIALWDSYEEMSKYQAWNEVMNQLKPGEKGAIKGALTVANHYAKLKTVGEVRRATTEQLQVLGAHRAQFLRQAFGTQQADLIQH